MSSVRIRHYYDGLQDQISHETGLGCRDKSLAKQSEKDSSDVNNILKRYEKTGVLPDLIREDGHYGDYSDVLTYQESLAVVSHAQEQFAALDAHVRLRFNNDPAEFLAFATDPKNAKEMRDLGLLKAEAPAPAPSEPVVAPGAPDAGAGAKK